MCSNSLSRLGTVFREVTDADQRMTPAQFVDGLDATLQMAAVVSIVFGLIAFALFHRQHTVAGAERDDRTAVAAR
ncbi:hypothetical protein [Nocardia sp. NPDC051463]|uniref:hypothetical protein n=1 Tax=Nocardia sp. NPDC051463 TaxID=3154845 RepID=UPI00344B1217